MPDSPAAPGQGTEAHRDSAQDYGQLGLHPYWLTTLLLGRMNLTPGKTFVIALIAYVVIPGTWAFLDGNLVPHDGVDTFLSTRNSYVFAVPFVFAAICAYYRNTDAVVAQLAEAGVLSGSIDDFHGVRHQAMSAIWLHGLSWLTRVFAVVIPIAFLTNDVHPAAVTWLFSDSDTPRWIAFYFVPMFHGLAIYAFGTWVVHHIRAARVLKALFGPKSRFRVKLTVLHPDTCMGLGPISEMVKYAAAVLIALGLVLFFWQAGVFLDNLMNAADAGPLATLMRDIKELQSSASRSTGVPVIGILTAWIAYGTFAPLVFFLPLTSAQAAMQTAKQRALMAVSQEITSGDDVLANERLVKHYELLHKERVWPFNVRTISSFLVTLASPIALTILTEIVKQMLAARD